MIYRHQINYEISKHKILKLKKCEEKQMLAIQANKSNHLSH